MTQNLTLKKRIEYRSAPIEILEHKKLSAESKLFLTWILMHQSGWVVIISYALSKCGISESLWQRKVRKELIELGFFKQTRTSKIVDGVQRFVWEQVVTDDPLLNLDKDGDEE